MQGSNSRHAVPSVAICSMLPRPNCSQRVSPDPKKNDKVKQLPNPTSTKEVHQFLGLASYYRRFIKDFLSIATPNSQRNILYFAGPQNAKKPLTTSSNPCSCSKPFILDIDANDTGIGLGAVLFWVQGSA